MDSPDTPSSFIGAPDGPPAGGPSAPTITSPAPGAITRATVSPPTLSVPSSPVLAHTPLKPGSPDHLTAAAVSGAVTAEGMEEHLQEAISPSSHTFSHLPTVQRNRSKSMKRGPGTASSGRSLEGQGGAAASAMVGSVTSSSAMSMGAASGSRSAHGGGRRRDKHNLALESIRKFLRGRSSYDVLPVSFRLVVLDTKLVVKPALDVMWQSGVVSAPLWQSSNITDGAGDEAEGGEGSTASADDKASSSGGGSSSQKKEQASGFAGMLTVNDIIHLIQYYYMNSSYDNAAKDVETFRLEKLKDIERVLHVPQPPTLSVHPLRSLYEACQQILKTHARRLPLIDHDEQTGIETVLSVLTQYRVLKFIAMNCRETAMLHRSIRSLGIGTYVGSTPGFTLRPSTALTPDRSQAASPSSAAGAVSPRSTVEPQLSAVDPGTEPVTPAATIRSEEAAWPASGDEGAEEHEGDSSGDAAGMRTPMAERPPLLSAFSSSGATTTSAAAAEASSSRSGEGQASGSSTQSGPTAPSPSAGSEASTFPRQGLSKLAEDVLSSAKNVYAPIATATLDTTVFDVVHLFSELGISAVPILDEQGNVVDLYEAVDVVTLVRTGAYHALDLTIRQALARRSEGFAGVSTCSPDDSLANIFALLRRRRVHRLLIMEPEVQPAATAQPPTPAAGDADDALLDSLSAGGGDAPAGLSMEERLRRPPPTTPRELEEELEAGVIRRRGKGKLVGILCLSDILRYVIGASAGATPGTAASSRPGSASAATPPPPPMASSAGSNLPPPSSSTSSSAAAAAAASGTGTAAQAQALTPLTEGEVVAPASEEYTITSPHSADAGDVSSPGEEPNSAGSVTGQQTHALH